MMYGTAVKSAPASMKVTRRFPESIIEPREGQAVLAVTAETGVYDNASNPTALKTAAYWVGLTPSEFTIKSDTTAQPPSSEYVLSCGGLLCRTIIGIGIHPGLDCQRVGIRRQLRMAVFSPHLIGGNSATFPR